MANLTCTAHERAPPVLTLTAIKEPSQCATQHANRSAGGKACSFLPTSVFPSLFAGGDNSTGEVGGGERGWEDGRG